MNGLFDIDNESFTIEVPSVLSSSESAILSFQDHMHTDRQYHVLDSGYT